jgi:hypothetical protein
MTGSRQRVEVPITKHLECLVQKGVPPATRTALFSTPKFSFCDDQPVYLLTTRYSQDQCTPQPSSSWEQDSCAFYLCSAAVQLTTSVMGEESPSPALATMKRSALAGKSYCGPVLVTL